MATPRNTTYELIYHLTRGNIPPAETPQVLSTIFDARDYKHSIQQLQEHDLMMWAEHLDQIIDSGIYPEQHRRRAWRYLQWTCESRRVLPRSHYFRGRLSRASNRPAQGGTADVWRVTGDRGELFAAKVFRANQGEDHKIKMYYKELTMWKRLNHPNVVPVLGAGPDIAELCVVSPWMPEGDLLGYLNKYPTADRVAIMIGVADGLSYLHFNEVVHGDLKGSHILFDPAGTPRILDFGNSSFTFDPTSNVASTPSGGYSVRWAAPEILDATNEESGHPTKMSDVYAFGMVVVEIFTGKPPFADLGELNVHLMVVKGKRPPKPVDASRLGLSSATWKLIGECWNKTREKRPEIEYVARHLRKTCGCEIGNTPHNSGGNFQTGSRSPYHSETSHGEGEPSRPTTPPDQQDHPHDRISPSRLVELPDPVQGAIPRGAGEFNSGFEDLPRSIYDHIED